MKYLKAAISADSSNGVQKYIKIAIQMFRYVQFQFLFYIINNVSM